MKHKYAQVIVDIQNLDTRTFSYLIPDEIADDISIGTPVLVPFGNRGVINAFVVGFNDYLPEGIKAKPVYEILDKEPVFTLEYLKFLEWTANYYCCSLQSVIEAAIPSNLFSKIKKIVSPEKTELATTLNKNQEKILETLKNTDGVTVSTLQKKTKIPSGSFYEALRKLRSQNIIKIENELDIKISGPKTERFIRLASKALNNPELLENLKPRYREIVYKLREAGGEAKNSEFLKLAKTTPATLDKIQEEGFIEIFEKEIFRNPLKIFETYEQQDFLDLTAYQQKALDKILGSFREKNTEPLLLYGITGSGKTEVYLHATREVLNQGKSVIILAPEIVLASQLAKRFATRFGTKNVALWHSNISEGERFDTWQKVRNGEIKIVVGARSAIFAPVKAPGLIVIDEEHESSYKQTSPAPRYNAKTLAIRRANMDGAAVVLGSATPDITSYFRAKNTENIISLPERVSAFNLPVVRLVDMREEYNTGNRSIFSRGLKHNLIKTFEEKKQAILLINRRGFSTYGQCTNCGHTPECKSCDIPLILHKTNNSLRCHYCNYERPIMQTCPECGSSAIKYYGMGTQRVEEMFKKEFPEARSARIDSDIMSKKNEHIRIIEAFSRGEVDVLIGTQMIAKGLDIPNVTLVGVLSSDSLFNMPDYRASERGFQLLTQVAGRAGRGDFSGKVYFQTYSPEYFAIRMAKEQDFLSFYNLELQSRNEFSYPPFSNIIRLIISNSSEIKAGKFAQEVAYKLKTLTDSRGLTERLEVLGPSGCVIPRIKNEYRFQVIIKNTLGEKGHFLVTNYIKQLKIPNEIKFLVDIDPSDML